MLTNRSLLFLILSLSLINRVTAQLTIPIDVEQASITIMPTGPYGFVVFDSLLYQKGEDDFFLKYTQYDTSFTQKWEQFVYFQEGDRIVNNYNSGEHIYLLFQTAGAYTRLSRMDARYGAVDTASFILPEKFEISSLHGLQENIWLVGTLQESPAILKMNLFTRTTQVIPLNVNQAKAQIVSPQIVNNEFRFVVVDKLQKLNRLVFHRLTDDNHDVTPINTLSKVKLSRIELVEDQYIIGQYGNDEAKADGIFTINLATSSYSELPLKDIWGDGKVQVLGQEDQKVIVRSNMTFLFEDFQVKDDSIIIWLEVYQQKFRSKNQTEKEIERDYRNFENFMSPGSFFGGTGGFTGSGTQIIEMRYRDAQINNAIATGFEYACHVNINLSSDGKISTAEMYNTPEVDHLSTLNNQNVYQGVSGSMILGYSDKSILSFNKLGKEQTIFPIDGEVDRLGQAKVTPWYSDTYMLRTYFRKDGNDYFTIRSVKLK